MKESKYWLKKMDVKVGVSDKKVISNMIVGIGSNILNDLLLDYYSQLVVKNN